MNNWRRAPTSKGGSAAKPIPKRPRTARARGGLRIRLENILQGELQVPAIARRCDSAECRGPKSSIRCIEIGVIHDIEDLEAEFQPLPFLDHEALEQGGIEIDD